MIFIGRLAASLLSASFGWAAGNAVTSSLILLQSPMWEWRGWALASGYVCLAAWALAGIPLAVSGACFPPGPARVKAILIGGLGAGGVMALLFGPGAIASSGGRVLFCIVTGQALATGGIAMLAYCLLSARLTAPGPPCPTAPSSARPPTPRNSP